MLISFIQQELGFLEYQDPNTSFHEVGIESFQVLEIIIELERQLGRQLLITTIPPDGLVSVNALLTSFDAA